MWVSP